MADKELTEEELKKASGGLQKPTGDVNEDDERQTRPGGKCSETKSAQVRFPACRICAHTCFRSTIERAGPTSTSVSDVPEGATDRLRSRRRWRLRCARAAES